MTALEEPDVQCLRQASCILYRSDLREHSGTAFCESCAEDALESGMFYEYGDQGDVFGGDSEVYGK